MTRSMTSRQLNLLGIPRCLTILAALLLLTPGTVFATHFELSRLASQIELISGQLAADLRYTRNYGSVRQRALTLSREASQLVDTLRRNRSNSRVRSQFKDVRRGYEKLEQAFFRADRRDHVPQLYREINLLSSLFGNLSDEFYYAGLGPRGTGSDYGSVRSGRGIISSRYSYGRNDSRARGPIAPHRERAVPPVFRGNSALEPNRQGGRGGRQDRGVDEPSRLNQGSRGAPKFDHSSPVLERQGRQNRERRDLEGQARQNRSPVTARQSARGDRGDRGERGDRGNRGQRIRSGRVTQSETGRRNHYE